MEDVSGVELPLQICVIGDDLARDKGFLQICSKFGHPVFTSLSGQEFFTDTSVRTIYVLPQFSGTVFDKLSDARKPILGPPAIRDLASIGQPLLVKKTPVYCLALFGCVIIFSGYRRKSDLERLLKLIHYMGGSVQKEAGRKMTQLLAMSSLGDKYQYANTFSIPVLTEAWLTAAWDNREAIGYRATSKEEYITYRLPTFQGNVVKFHGFEAEEMRHMEEVLVANGGRVTLELDKETTHLIVDENNVEHLPEDLDIPSGCHVVKGEWFWNSIQIEAAADVHHYKWRKEEGYSTATLLSPNRSYNMFSPTSVGAMTLSPSTSNRKRKRMRRAEMIASLAADSPVHKRRSSVSELAMLSISGSFLDNTDKEKANMTGDRTLISPEASPARGAEVILTAGEVKVERGTVFDAKTATARQQVFHEFVTTESNYVGVLDCISKISSEAENPNQQGGALLDEQEMKIIFGSMPPILKVHSEMLKKLIEAENNWTESMKVGTILLEYTEDMLRAYPPFVNFFENTKNKIHEVDKKNPRFHAFLKKCERRPECSRQTLTELMIRPVQRLPSISLLLNDIMKHTRRADPNHQDCPELEKALAKIKEVMTHLNEEKRRTEGQIHIFDVYSEIENCPASIVSSHRSFVSRADVIEVAAEDAFCGKGYELTLFLFTDILVITKRKATKGMGMMRSPSAASLAAGQQHVLPHKALKFVRMIHLSAVRRLVDILDPETEGLDASVMSTTSSVSTLTTNMSAVMLPGAREHSTNLVALVCKDTEDLRERCYTLQLAVDSQEDKWAWLKTMCRNVSNTLCRPDPDQLLVRLFARDMNFDANDLNVSTFSRALSSFQKTKQKVGRAFSFNKTPSKMMKRAVSTVISPLTSSAKVNRPQVPGHLGTPGEHGMEFRPEGRDTPRSSRAMLAQSCVDLLEADSPRSRTFPKRFNFQQESPRRELGAENRDPDFRTPNLCSRPSFRDKFRSRPRAGTLGGFMRKDSAN